jgi:high-affinity nickel permease
MTNMLSVVVLGFLLGMRHATDADHVVAIATIVSRERVMRTAAWIGALWGIGHTVTIMLVGAPIVLFNWVVAPRFGLAMELAVGVMLVLLGLRNLAPHHRHSHADEKSLRPFVVGIVHGLAGSAAVALLVLTTIQDATWAIAYLLVFGIGTVAGMVMITTAIAIPLAGARSCSARTHGYIRAATGLLSFGFGLFLAYRIGIAWHDLSTH